MPGTSAGHDEQRFGASVRQDSSSPLWGEGFPPRSCGAASRSSSEAVARQKRRLASRMAGRVRGTERKGTSFMRSIGDAGFARFPLTAPQAARALPRGESGESVAALRQNDSRSGKSQRLGQDSAPRRGVTRGHVKEQLPEPALGLDPREGMARRKAQNLWCPRLLLGDAAGAFRRATCAHLERATALGASNCAQVGQRPIARAKIAHVHSRRSQLGTGPRFRPLHHALK